MLQKLAAAETHLEFNMKRRKFLTSVAALTAGVFAAPKVFSITNNTINKRNITMAKFELPQLPYAYDALEPYMDKMTMEIHHSKHHATYTANFNKVLEDNKIEAASAEEVLKSVSKYPVAVRNNGGGYVNHNFFWLSLSGVKSEPSAELVAAINASFGSLDEFKKQFSNAALTRFGSGWAWLVLSNGKLVITSTPNQDSPIMDVADVKGAPLLNLDVWEHAYYLKYQNRRAEFIENFWHVVNWAEVSKRYAAAK